jgi:hypothetical protein
LTPGGCDDGDPDAKSVKLYSGSYGVGCPIRLA